jgi:hypothetical protein
MNLIIRKQAISDYFESLAKNINLLINNNKYFYKENNNYMKFLVGKDKCVL